MNLKYKHWQIIKHALQHYVQRDGASTSDLRSEHSLLNSVTAEVEDQKARYGIRSKGASEE